MPNMLANLKSIIGHRKTDFSWHAAFEERMKEGKRKFRNECKQWINAETVVYNTHLKSPSMKISSLRSPNVLSPKASATNSNMSSRFSSTVPSPRAGSPLPMLEDEMEGINEDDFGKYSSENLHQSLLEAIQLLLHPGWSQAILSKAWDTFDTSASGFIDAEQNDRLIGSYLTSFAYHFPKYVESLFDAYKGARMAVQQTRLRGMMKQKAKNEVGEDLDEADATVIKILRTDNVFDGDDSELNLKGGIEEDPTEVVRMLSDGIDDELKMRLATLQKANVTVLMHASDIATEAFKKMHITSSAKIERWEMLECFELAVTTAQELILLRAEAESNKDFIQEPIEASIKNITIRNHETLSNSSAERKSPAVKHLVAKSQEVSLIDDIPPLNHSLTDSISTNCINKPRANLDHIEARLRTRQRELRDLRKTKSMNNLRSLGFS